MTDLKQEMWRMSKRVDQVEGQVTKQMQQTINMLDEITVKHAAQGEVLQQLQEANREVTGSSAWRREGGPVLPQRAAQWPLGRHSASRH